MFGQQVMTRNLWVMSNIMFSVQVRATAEERARALAAQCGAIQHLRADSEDKERRAVS
jgi:hypothetical protein